MSSGLGGTIGGTAYAFNEVKDDTSLTKTILARATLCPLGGVLGGIIGFISGPFFPFVTGASVVQYYVKR